jgi:hypothetical protein
MNSASKTPWYLTRLNRSSNRDASSWWTGTPSKQTPTPSFRGRWSTFVAARRAAIVLVHEAADAIEVVRRLHVEPLNHRLVDVRMVPAQPRHHTDSC